MPFYDIDYFFSKRKLLPAVLQRDEPTRAINVEIWGYNIGDAELETSIDTNVYRNFRMLPNKPLTFSKVYTFRA